MVLGISPVNNDAIGLPARARAQTRDRTLSAAATRARYCGDKDGGDKDTYKDGGGVAVARMAVSRCSSHNDITFLGTSAIFTELTETVSTSVRT